MPRCYTSLVLKSVTQKRAKAEWDGARRGGITESELLARVSRKPVLQRVLPVVSDDPDTVCIIRATSRKPRTLLSTPNVVMSKGSSGRYNSASDQEEGVLPVDRPRHSTLHPIAEFRDVSTSAWLHFPHIELVFLFFAFKGFVAAQVWGIRHTKCLPVSITAAVLLVRYGRRFSKQKWLNVNRCIDVVFHSHD